VDGTPGFKSLLLDRGVVCRAKETMSYIAIDNRSCMPTCLRSNFASMGLRVRNLIEFRMGGILDCLKFDLQCWNRRN